MRTDFYKKTLLFKKYTYVFQSQFFAFNIIEILLDMCTFQLISLEILLALYDILSGSFSSETELVS